MAARPWRPLREQEDKHRDSHHPVDLGCLLGWLGDQTGIVLIEAEDCFLGRDVTTRHPAKVPGLTGMSASDSISSDELAAMRKGTGSLESRA